MTVILVPTTAVAPLSNGRLRFSLLSWRRKKDTTMARIVRWRSYSFLKSLVQPHFARTVCVSTHDRGVSKFTGSLNRQKAQDLIFRLQPNERKLLMEELELHISVEMNGKTMGPTAEQLKMVAIHNALPFVGFGFLDNFIMIVAGDYIDTTIGLTLGISTMAAAGLGNAISDAAGIGSAWYVEKLAARIGVQAPKLTAAQMEMASTRWSSNIGRAIGVFVGCLLGMLPLLFLSSKEDIIHKKERRSKEGS